MLASMRKSLTVVVAVLAGLAGLSFLMAAPPVGVPGIDFTPDGKFKRPVGYRKCVYVGELMTPTISRWRGHVPRVPYRLHGPRDPTLPLRRTPSYSYAPLQDSPPVQNICLPVSS